jgi:hypothetical protein
VGDVSAHICAVPLGPTVHVPADDEQSGDH